MSSPLFAAVQKYAQRGWAPIPIPHLSKNPGFEGWEKTLLKLEDLDKHFNGKPQNVGLLLGEPSGGLVDIDLDTQESAQLAPVFLPKTGFVFGRKSKPKSHYIYLAKPLVKTAQFKDEQKQMLVELRSTGAQTIFPPSTHPSGELIAFDQEQEPGIVVGPKLAAAVGRLAAASILVRVWPREKGRHDLTLPLAGMLLRGGLSVEAVEHFIKALCWATGDEEIEDRAQCVRSTAEALRNGHRVTGAPTLAQDLGEPLVKKVRQWLLLEKDKTPKDNEPVRIVPPPSSGMPYIETTDSGNAEHFARELGHLVRYDHNKERWLVWQEHHFRPDTDGVVERMAREAMKKIYLAAADIQDPQLQQKIAKHAISSRAAGKLTAMLSLAKTEKPIADAGEDWDSDPWLLGVPNGTIDLKTGQLRPGKPEDRVTMRAGVAFDPEAKCPRFERFLREIYAGQEELVDFVFRYAGYSLTGITNEQFLTMHHGQGANGKSTLFKVLAKVLGEYGHVMPFSALEDWSSTRVPTEVAALLGKRLVLASEVNEGVKLNEGRVKSLTGCDPISARHLYEKGFTFEPVAKFWLGVNHKPKISDDSHGFWRRVALLPYSVKFEEGKNAQDDLEEQLNAEWPGILAWMVRGCLEWQKRRLKPFPQRVKQATDAYREEEDQLGQFLSACCVETRNAKVTASALYQAYKQWGVDNGLGDRDTLSLQKFGRRIGSRFQKGSEGGHITHYYGIGLKA